MYSHSLFAAIKETWRPVRSYLETGELNYVHFSVSLQLMTSRTNPTETAVVALEFVMKHDDLSPLKPMDLHQSFWVRQHLDVYAVGILFVLVTGLIPFGIIRILRFIS